LNDIRLCYVDDDDYGDDYDDCDGDNELMMMMMMIDDDDVVNSPGYMRPEAKANTLCRSNGV